MSDERQISFAHHLVDAGIDGFQVRAKQSSARDMTRMTRKLIDEVRPRSIPVLVNDRLDVALAVDADGVHLGQDDLAVAEARRLAPWMMIGATCRTREDVVRAEGSGADYAGIGPLFPSTSKADLPEPLGQQNLEPAVGVLPLIGIGGINQGRASAVVNSGAHGIAVISAIWDAPDPINAARDLAVALAKAQVIL
ncbi:thiamine phosphate synthase [Nocardioides kongjuensis]|uniref:Thiamine-phosphate synthase n=1 Tax=Nocardioides kongjuensis TaxID=349522 RepID=A0A852RMU2_9ACTN|nr:thiamine-phosphate pyrophosphorylase [Nocardioides kongjuensis]